jgi:hypothetical protein
MKPLLVRMDDLAENSRPQGVLRRCLELIPMFG